MPHFIRLRGAWNLERQTAPAGEHVNVRLTRDFGCSSGLKTASRVWLSILNAASEASAELNGRSLGRICTSQSRFDVTSLLRPRNTLTIEFSAAELSLDGLNADAWADVRLEIEE